MNKTYLFELLGELRDMPRDEVIATSVTESNGNCRTVSSGPGYVVMDLPEECVDGVNDRLALTKATMITLKRALELIGVSAPEKM